MPHQTPGLAGYGVAGSAHGSVDDDRWNGDHMYVDERSGNTR